MESNNIWEDDTRMTVLFSPLRDRDLNPSSWTQKVEFWMQAIISECKKCGKVIMDIPSLSQQFLRNGKPPQCLDSVVKEMVLLGTLKKLTEEDFLTVETHPLDRRKGWLTWGYDKLLKSPLSWGWGMIKGNKPEDAKYIVVDVLNTLSEEILKKHFNNAHCDVTDSVILYKELFETHASLMNSEEDFSVVLQNLVFQKKVVVLKENSQLLIKFPSTRDKTVKPFCEQDLQIYRIKSTSTMLIHQVEKLDADKTRLRKEALFFKKQKQKQQALRSLRQYKRVQARIDQLTRSLDMLDDIMGRIRHAMTDEMVMKALQSGADALKGLTSKVDLDHVSNIMDSVKEAIEDQDDIHNEMSTTSTLLTDTSDQELEQELQDLLKDSDGEKNTVQELNYRDNIASCSVINDRDSSSEDAGEEFNADKEILEDIDNSPSVHVNNNEEDVEIADLLSDLHLPDVPSFSPSKLTLDKEDKVTVKDRKPEKQLELAT